MKRRAGGNAQKGLAYVKGRVAWQNEIDHRIGGYGRGIQAGKTVHDVGDDGDMLEPRWSEPLCKTFSRSSSVRRCKCLFAPKADLGIGQMSHVHFFAVGSDLLLKDRVKIVVEAARRTDELAVLNDGADAHECVQ